jgi:hypothetical protein
MGAIAKDLISLLEVCEQELEPNLIRLAVDFENGDIEEDEEEKPDEDEQYIIKG